MDPMSRRRVVIGGACVIAVVVGAVGAALWDTAAPPTTAEIEALVASGETSAIINGWEVKVSPGTEDGDREGSYMETVILHPVSPGAMLRSIFFFLGASY